MATRVFTDEELAALRRFPEIGREELARFFTLTSADVAFIASGRGRGPADRLGLAVAVCALPWLGFVPDDVASAPRAAVVRLAEQLAVNPDAVRSYGRRVKTRTDHLRLAARYLDWRVPGSLELKELDEFLLARAMEHDSPTLLFRLGCEYLRSARVIRPGPVTVVERVAHAREQAQRETLHERACLVNGHYRTRGGSSNEGDGESVDDGGHLVVIESRGGWASNRPVPFCTSAAANWLTGWGDDSFAVLCQRAH